VERFDRERIGDAVRRRHVIDSCQLLNRARTFKYTAANLAALNSIADACRSRARARMQLFQWLVFNLVVGNTDNHLKNISAMVGPEGIELAPAYDLLSTAVYTTRAFQDQPTWPDIELALPLPDATQLGLVTRDRVIAAAAELGVPLVVAVRELDRLVRVVTPAAHTLIGTIEADNAALPAAARAELGGELRLLRAIVHNVIIDMVARLR
jgi:serine/threonine-protein kinase HipA